MSAPMIASRTSDQILGEFRDLRAEANRLPLEHQRRKKMERRIDRLTDAWIEAETARHRQAGSTS